MKKHLNTLYVTTQGAYLAKEGETVVVSVEREVRLQLPLLTIGGIVCFGHVTVSPALMGFCWERGVGISFLSEHGRFLARVVGPTTGNVLLRREQYRRADGGVLALPIARAIVAAKVQSTRAVLLRAAREHPQAVGEKGPQTAAEELSWVVRQLEVVPSVEECRGLEGLAARKYFEVFDALIVQQKEAFSFRGRSRRPPLDRVNALLSFAYALLMHDVKGALESVGLDPNVGFLHADRPGRASLALDLMEELRPWLADRLVCSLINLKQLSERDFYVFESGAVVLEDAGRKEVLAAWQKRKQEDLTHPFLGERTTVGLVPQLQALLLARHLRGDLADYPPFVWR